MFKILKVGADVEMFLKNNQDQLVPAVGLIGGTKQKPRAIDDKGSALQEDNVMLEFNIIPAGMAATFVKNINKVLDHTITELREKGLVMDIAPARTFDWEQLRTEQARTMGCDPDWSAWTFEENPLLSPDILQNVRTAGGHVHISFNVNEENPNELHKVNVIRALDLSLGIPSVIIDTDPLRRSFYGRAGAWRNKGPDRVEYRTLSNFWIKDDLLKAWVFNNIKWAFNLLNSRHGDKELFVAHQLIEDFNKRVFTDNDISFANALVHHFKIPMPEGYHNA